MAIPFDNVLNPGDRLSVPPGCAGTLQMLQEYLYVAISRQSLYLPGFSRGNGCDIRPSPASLCA